MNGRKFYRQLEKSRLILSKGDEILVLQKQGFKKSYGLPGGFLKKGESPKRALIREVKEEVGVKFKKKELSFVDKKITTVGKTGELTKYYYHAVFNDQSLKLQEPHKFKKLKWVQWKKAIKRLRKIDKKIVKDFFKPLQNVEQKVS